MQGLARLQGKRNLTLPDKEGALWWLRVVISFPSYLSTGPWENYTPGDRSGQKSSFLHGLSQLEFSYEEGRAVERVKEEGEEDRPDRPAPGNSTWGTTD